VFTHDGIGTMVVDEKLESLREATSDDVGGILQLIEPFERDGTLVRASAPRSSATSPTTP
jgi:amino-acid N-acetyltransferase